jgi:RNA polymerase sigma factor (sigma-70 family)
MLAGLSDHTLVGLVAAGSDDAFAALDLRYRRRLVRFAQGFVTGGTADAEDAVQEAMVRAVRALRNGSRPDAVGPWLHRIARNCALDISGARRRHPVVELADHAHPVAEDASVTVERRLGVRGLVDDVSDLPQTQRSALVLRELEGRSYAAIADELDVTVPAVKSLLVRARQGLRRARDDRRVAAWLPLPLLSRFGDRIAALWEPVAATATPKVACAAVVLAGAVPTISSQVTAPSSAVPKAQQEQTASAAGATPPTGHRPVSAAATATAARSVAATAATVKPKADAAAALPSALREDCSDGTIDGAYGRSALTAAYAGAEAGEYTDCKRALAQAIL